ncbi:putative methyl-accepting chemotaxis sensory transducer [Burkholderiales bacterium GJ-E10]|nr:putative methyl-accepting chemotaxis sensory transducer [Burkholderiales bacterium GJ-E10]
MIAAIQVFLGQIYAPLGSLSGIPLLCFLLASFLTIAYVFGFLGKGFVVGSQLKKAVSAVEALSDGGKGVSPDRVAKAMEREPLRHLWNEYSDSLHEVKRGSGAAGALTEIRATQPAELFFTREALVDSRLLDDFVRHLPGLLTGIGIIGTFFGLLGGLSGFDASTSATAVAGLKPLLMGVAHAFLVSATAIACAMFVTSTSRFLLARCYQLVEKLNHKIDALYSTGAGEEYLSRLVHSSEKAEAHAAQLKQALIEDLTTLMTNLTERQIQAQIHSHQSLGTQLGETLSGPLKEMTNALQTTSQGNSQAVTGMLESMLAGFMAKLEDTFGGQMRGINEQIAHSVEVMNTAQSSLQKLIDDMGRANQQAANGLSGVLEEAIRQNSANQAAMVDQMRDFLQEMRSRATEEQDKAKRAMDEAVGSVLKQLSVAVEQMEEVRRGAVAQEQGRNQQLSQRTQELVSGLSGQVDTLLKSVGDIGAVSLRAVEGMNAGAATMESAARRFESAGGSVSTVFDKSQHVAEQLTTASGALQTAAAAIREGFQKYDSTRAAVDGHVASLTALVETAKREAGLSKVILTDLERIVEQLRRAESQSEAYLQGVNGALVEAFEKFGTALNNQLTKTIGATDSHMERGVQHLTGVVDEIAAAMSRLKKV